MIYSPSSHSLTFLLLDKYNDLYKLSYIKKNVLALPRFIMAVDGKQQIEAQKCATIHRKQTSNSSRGLIKAF